MLEEDLNQLDTVQNSLCKILLASSKRNSEASAERRIEGDSKIANAENRWQGAAYSGLHDLVLQFYVWRQTQKKTRGLGAVIKKYVATKRQNTFSKISEIS
jgi:hypothetical protein